VDGTGFVINWPDLVLINTNEMGTAGHMSPFQVVTFSGKVPRVIRSFGAQAAAPPNSQRYASLSRVLAPARNRTYWATEYQRYELTLWSLDGKILKTLRRQSDWFPAEPQRLSFREPPPPHVRTMAVDGQDRLWVFVNVAAPTWREGYPKLGPGISEVGPEAFSYEKLYRTTVEVLDPTVARVVVRTTLNQYVVTPLPGGRAAVYNTTASGEPYVQIVRLAIRQ
jgi:hypothetical protein